MKIRDDFKVGFLISFFFFVGVANNIGDGKFMIIHGVEDDNVNIDHTLTMSKSLIKNNIIFRQQLYPGNLGLNFKENWKK